MATESSLRPRGSVEVCCAHPGCGTAWWVDPLDPLLLKKGHVWDCGDSHGSTILLHTRLALLNLQHGIKWGTLHGSGPKSEPETPCGMDVSKGHVFVNDRTGRKRGYLEWNSIAELKDVDAVAARIEWDPTQWPQPDVLSNREPATPGYVHWVGYHLESGFIRKYTFVPCSRCGSDVYVDIRDPFFKVGEYSVGSWGGGELPTPSWWGTVDITCELGLGSTGLGPPCEAYMVDSLRHFEEASESRWTEWTTLGRNRGTVLFFRPEDQVYGLLTYETLDIFAKGDFQVVWGSLRDAERLLRVVREKDDGYDPILWDMAKILREPS